MCPKDRGEVDFVKKRGSKMSCQGGGDQEIKLGVIPRKTRP